MIEMCVGGGDHTQRPTGGDWGKRDRVTLLIFDIEQIGNLTCSTLTVSIERAEGSRQRRFFGAALAPLVSSWSRDGWKWKDGWVGLSLFLHTSAAGGQGCAEATASQLPNSLSNLLVGFELQPSPFPPPLVAGFSAAVVDIQIGAALTLAPLQKKKKERWIGEWKWQHGNHIFTGIKSAVQNHKWNCNDKDLHDVFKPPKNSIALGKTWVAVMHS